MRSVGVGSSSHFLFKISFCFTKHFSRGFMANSILTWQLVFLLVPIKWGSERVQMFLSFKFLVNGFSPSAIFLLHNFFFLGFWTTVSVHLDNIPGIDPINWHSQLEECCSAVSPRLIAWWINFCLTWLHNDPIQPAYYSLSPGIPSVITHKSDISVLLFILFSLLGKDNW